MQFVYRCRVDACTAIPGWGGAMILSNTETVPGKTIVRFYGVVSGSTVRAKNVGRDILASLRNLVGGELKAYTELLNEARADALERMTVRRSRSARTPS